MKVNIPYKIRTALYILTVVGTPMVTVLFTNGIIPELGMQLWAAFVTGVGALAAYNVTPDEPTI